MSFLSIPWLATGSLIHILLFFLVCIHCLQNRREATSTLLWIFLAWSFPILGPFLFLTIGVDRLSRRGKVKRKKNAQFREVAHDTLPWAYWHSVHASDLSAELPYRTDQRINRALDTMIPDFPLLQGNSMKLLISGDDAYPTMKEAIASAKDHIHFQCFIIDNDDVTRDFMNALAEKARQGVSVRILFDRFGSTKAVLTGFFRQYHKIPNMHIKGWTQVNPLKRRFQVNLRNHRKSLVVDGKVGFFGGVNLSKKNTTSPALEAIRDYHFEMQGPVVQQLQYAFLLDWYFMSSESPESLLNKGFFPPLEHKGEGPSRIINSGPASDFYTIEEAFFMMATAAKQQILIVTPYFVPSASLRAALRAAALRSIDVRIILPEKNNHFYAGWAARAFYEELLQAGVKIYHRPPPFMHAKGMLIDSRTGCVGTANWDIRSLHLNYETNMIFHSETMGDQLKAAMLQDESVSQLLQYGIWLKRPTWQKLLENACALLSPIL